MDAPATLRSPAWPDSSAPVVRQLLQATWVTLLSLAVLLTLLVFERRVAGALRDPLPALPLAALGVGLAVSALAFRHFAHRPGDRSPPAFAIYAAPTLVVALLAIGLLVPGTTVMAWASFLGVLLVEEGWSWGQLFPLARVPRSTSTGSPAPSSIDTQPTIASLDERLGSRVAVLDDPDAGADSEIDENATQWMVRRRDPEIGEIIEGWVKCTFERGQRHATAHLAICPPLTVTPVCYAEASDGPPCQVKVGQVLPYGARLEIKLDEAAAEPSEVQVEFSILERAAE